MNNGVLECKTEKQLDSWSFEKVPTMGRQFINNFLSNGATP